VFEGLLEPQSSESGPENSSPYGAEGPALLKELDEELDELDDELWYEPNVASRAVGVA